MEEVELGTTQTQKVMTYEEVKKICRESNLYETDELNEVLYLHMKGFHSIGGLASFTNLKCLFLNNNCIKEIENLGGLTNLRALYLQNNDIHSIKNIECTSLVTLNLANNKIKRLGNLGHLKGLQTLNVSHNLIEEIEDIAEVAKLHNLSHLDLSGNHLNFHEGIDADNLKNFLHDMDGCSSAGLHHLGADDKHGMALDEATTLGTLCPPHRSTLFEEFLHLREDPPEDGCEREPPRKVKYHQNVQSMDQLTRKKIIFLCELIILLNQLGKLRTLLVKNNPFLSKIRHASRYLVANIPNLTFLDDKKIKKEDICLARMFLKRGPAQEMELKKIFEKRKMEKYKNLSEKFHAFLMAQSGGS
ncbi:leucine-rich repeat protein [Plasmodium knowlesi strain H]|uniref:Leucine-rich repeat protein n=3 Tax=Plasmodium knowlesi TaxID=5850 RepID=A0A5K1V8B4_PLAKH|nr:leucine-rich repeat protein [Plasmodium knowlesi strain H]OTN67196.1 Leucine-rich repeat protein [Plasmodium knowlesi]CAA9988748.1 leucine-rich repeat protein [Plasmodium knowlesi strain H]SBO21698.1 leucine-rich repeat protein [Plasmodium knowlesi strain H]SBO22075.1 leucine-rich repeat protein [Plasmodium knowlesi strain H]VVS78222.1 leucine-rich repeat protein [Plasmodium knowlesi strain H]|eukprot:XP_002259724.1 Phosphatase 1 regulatory subunit, putative [Plasmodium knowlesi strain H]